MSFYIDVFIHLFTIDIQITFYHFIHIVFQGKNKRRRFRITNDIKRIVDIYIYGKPIIHISIGDIDKYSAMSVLSGYSAG